MKLSSRIITAAGHTWAWRRMPQNPGGFSSQRRGRSSRSQKSAASIIATNAERPEDNLHAHEARRFQARIRLLPALDFTRGFCPLRKPRLPIGFVGPTALHLSSVEPHNHCLTSGYTMKFLPTTPKYLAKAHLRRTSEASRPKSIRCRERERVRQT